jgi:hypothetical protein
MNNQLTVIRVLTRSLEAGGIQRFQPVSEGVGVEESYYLITATI